MPASSQKKSRPVPSKDLKEGGEFAQKTGAIPLLWLEGGKKACFNNNEGTKGKRPRSSPRGRKEGDASHYTTRRELKGGRCWIILFSRKEGRRLTFGHARKQPGEIVAPFVGKGRGGENFSFRSPGKGTGFLRWGKRREALSSTAGKSGDPFPRRRRAGESLRV